MNLLFKLLGIDEEEYMWMDLAMCKTMHVNYFFDYYEEDPIIANSVDEHCKTCPVMEECGKFAQAHKQQGVWGGIYWSDNGKPDPIRNKHKSPEDLAKLKALYK